MLFFKPGFLHWLFGNSPTFGRKCCKRAQKKPITTEARGLVEIEWMKRERRGRKRLVYVSSERCAGKEQVGGESEGWDLDQYFGSYHTGTCWLWLLLFFAHIYSAFHPWYAGGKNTKICEATFRYINIISSDPISSL